METFYPAPKAIDAYEYHLERAKTLMNSSRIKGKLITFGTNHDYSYEVSVAAGGSGGTVGILTPGPYVRFTCGATNGSGCTMYLPGSQIGNDLTEKFYMATRGKTKWDGAGTSHRVACVGLIVGSDTKVSLGARPTTGSYGGDNTHFTFMKTGEPGITGVVKYGTSTVAIDTNTHTFEIGSDGTTKYAAVDAEPWMTASTAIGNASYQGAISALNGGTATDAYFDCDYFFYAFPGI